MIFLESPVPILVCGSAVVAVLAVILLRTGRGVLLWAMLGVMACVGLGVLVERLVVTERERVMETVYGVAAAAQANNLPGVLKCISPSVERPQQRARWVRDVAQLSEVKVRSLEITINRMTSPPTAKAKFNAVVTGSFRQMPGEGTRVVQVGLVLRRESDRWLITEYELPEYPGY